MQKLSPDYIVGLVDGEGSFTVYIRDPESSSLRKRRTVVEPKFYLKLIERDKHILNRLKMFFECGSVYFQKDTRPNHQHCYRFEVYNRSDINKKIIPFFRKHKLQLVSKRKDFDIFCKIMRLINKNQHRNENGVKKLFQLKQQMH